MLYLLKLGGSLITDKNIPQTPRMEVITRLAQEIRAVHRARPDLKLVLGHGSGSFGHMSARKYGTRGGVRSPEDWLGFAEVWRDARALNQIVIEALAAAGLPVIAFPPSASVTAEDGAVYSWDLEPVRAALAAGLIPLINGDTIFDRRRGGTILSTEDLFFHLAPRLDAGRILLAGIEEGVWADYPTCQNLAAQITPDNYPHFVETLSGSAAVDVTGGMVTKVSQMLNLVQSNPGMQALIFSGVTPGNVERALLGGTPGTRICHQDTCPELS